MIPPGCNIPTPTDLSYIQDYFMGYLLDKNVHENEAYTYGSRIGEQLDKVIDMLKRTPNTNQASIIVGRPEDLDKLYCTTFWRSWDLWAGLPSNLGGMALLMDYVSSEIGKEIGWLLAYSSGAHIYQYQVPYVEERCRRIFNQVTNKIASDVHTCAQ